MVERCVGLNQMILDQPLAEERCVRVAYDSCSHRDLFAQQDVPDCEHRIANSQFFGASERRRDQTNRIGAQHSDITERTIMADQLGWSALAVGGDHHDLGHPFQHVRCSHDMPAVIQDDPGGQCRRGDHHAVLASSLGTLRVDDDDRRSYTLIGCDNALAVAQRNLSHGAADR